MFAQIWKSDRIRFVYSAGTRRLGHFGRLDRALRFAAGEWGLTGKYRVRVRPVPRGDDGFYNARRRLIVIGAHSGPAGQLRTALHELRHAWQFRRGHLRTRMPWPCIVRTLSWRDAHQLQLRLWTDPATGQAARLLVRTPAAGAAGFRAHALRAGERPVRDFRAVMARPPDFAEAAGYLRLPWERDADAAADDICGRLREPARG